MATQAALSTPAKLSPESTTERIVNLKKNSIGWMLRDYFARFLRQINDVFNYFGRRLLMKAELGHEVLAVRFKIGRPIGLVLGPHRLCGQFSFDYFMYQQFF